MPLYDYKCEGCGAEAEVAENTVDSITTIILLTEDSGLEVVNIPGTGDKLVCKNCKCGDRVIRLISKFGKHGSWSHWNILGND
jgi:hypothetical protein